MPLADLSSAQLPSEVDRPTVSATGSRVHFSMFWIGLVLVIAACVYCTYTVLFTFPLPQDVLRKQRVYHFGEKRAIQDSVPTPPEEVNFLLITDEDIDVFSSIQMMMYWNFVKDGPAMSMNFRENYETFKDYYYLRCVGAGILLLLALSLWISSFFLGRSKTIGTRQGTVWK